MELADRKSFCEDGKYPEVVVVDFLIKKQEILSFDDFFIIWDIQDYAIGPCLLANCLTIYIVFFQKYYITYKQSK